MVHQQWTSGATPPADAGSKQRHGLRIRSRFYGSTGGGLTACNVHCS